MSFLCTGRALARAELGGTSVPEKFSLADATGTDSLSHAEFWEVTLVVTKAALWSWGYIERPERGLRHFQGLPAQEAAFARMRQQCVGRSHGYRHEKHSRSPLPTESSDSIPLDRQEALFLASKPFLHTHMKISSLSLTPNTHRFCAAWEACRAW